MMGREPHRRVAAKRAQSAWLTLVVSLIALSANARDHDYVGAQKCKTCHGKELIGNQYKAWRNDRHSRAFETLKNEHSARIAAERGLVQPAYESDDCLRCHVTTHGVPPERIYRPMQASDGVQCESCHGPGRDYRKKKIMSDRERAVSKGLWLAGEDPAICTACHNEESPTHDPERYTLLDETTVGFDFEQAVERVDHPIPEDVRGHFIELEKKQRDAEKAAERSQRSDR